MPPRPIALHPHAITAYLRAVDDLAATISRTGSSEPSKNTPRDLVETMVVPPPGPDRLIRVQVNGHLASLIGGEAFPQGGRVVAEEGLEPPTPGL